jgi:long-subunit fatty acid transport protein
VGLAVGAFSVEARAGGFEVPDLGTVPIGRGGAFVAKADTLAAFHYNPAGLSKLPGPNLLVSGNAIHLKSSFQRRGSGQDVQLPWNDDGITVLDPAGDVNTGRPFPEVANARRFGPSPMFVASLGDAGVPGLAFAIGVTPPVGFGSHDWPEDGPQRYTIKRGSFLFLSYGAGVSYRVNRYFSIGATFLAGFFHADFRVATRSGSTGTMSNEDLEGDATVRLEATDRFIPSGNIGVLSNPIDALELGLSVRLPFQTRATGTFDYTAAEATPDATPASTPFVELRQTFPTVVRAGARYIHDVFDVELDFVFENYGRVDRIDVQFSNAAGDLNPAEILPASPYDDPNLLYLDSLGNGTVYTPIVATPVRLDFRDTYSVRLGSDVAIVPGRLTLRGGGFFASSAYPEDHATYSIRFPFTDQIGLGAGATWHAIPQLDVSLGYLHIFQPPVVVDGGVAQANAFREPYEDQVFGNIVNNGVYRSSLDIFGISLQAHFVRKRRLEGLRDAPDPWTPGAGRARTRESGSGGRS